MPEEVMQMWSYLYQSSGIKELINFAVISKDVSAFGIYKAIDSMIIQSVLLLLEQKPKNRTSPEFFNCVVKVQSSPLLIIANLFI